MFYEQIIESIPDRNQLSFRFPWPVQGDEALVIIQKIRYKQYKPIIS